VVSGKHNLEGKVAVITGGGTGLGKVMALTLARAGADIVIAGRRVPPIEQIASEVKDLGRRSLAIPTDIADSAQCNRLIERTVVEMAGLDILINNAGGTRGGERKLIQDIADEDWQYVMDINVTGTFYCCRAVAKHFLGQKSGKVINVATGLALRGERDNYPFSAAKAGIILLTRSLALSWAGDNIQVNTIAPGFIDARRWQPEPRQITPQQMKRRQAFTPVGQVGKPDDIASLALFLASDASDYITGALFAAEGGALAGGYAPVRHAPVIPLEEE